MLLNRSSPCGLIGSGNWVAGIWELLLLAGRTLSGASDRLVFDWLRTGPSEFLQVTSFNPNHTHFSLLPNNLKQITVFGTWIGGFP